MMILGINGTLQLDHLVEGPNLPLGGEFLVHRWYRHEWRPGLINHEAQEYSDKAESGVSELTEILGIRGARQARTLKPGQQATIRTGKGLREVVLLVHRMA